MKILSVGNFEYGWDGSICDEEHIAAVLERMGHEVVRWPRTQGTPQMIGGSSGYDFILISQWDGYDAEAWKRYANYAGGYHGGRDWKTLPIVYWAFDYQAGGQLWHEVLVEIADLYLSKRIEDSRYPNWQWLAQDFAPVFLDKYPVPLEKDIDVLFTGSYLPHAIDRIETLKAIDEKFNLVIHTVNPDYWRNEGFKNVLGPLMDFALPELYARAKVNIAIDHTLEAGYWSDRAAQIMCCGGFVMTRYIPLMEVRFHNFVDYFSSKEEAVARVGWWLEYNEDREALATKGYEYAMKWLKVDKRVEDLLEIVKRKLPYENSTV